MEAILFDVDDTLYDLAEPFVRTFLELYGGEKQVDTTWLFMRNRFYSDEVYEKSMTGEMSMDDMYVYRYQNAFADAGISISRKEALTFQRVYEKRQREITLTDETRRMLQVCGSYAKLGIITNGPEKHQWDKIQDLGLLQWIPEEAVFVSSQVGCAKPHREIFDLAAARLGVRAEDAWFVGDSFDCDIMGAQGAGWHTVWMNHRGRTIRPGAQLPDYEVRSMKELRLLLEAILPK